MKKKRAIYIGDVRFDECLIIPLSEQQQYTIEQHLFTPTASLSKMLQFA